MKLFWHITVDPQHKVLSWEKNTMCLKCNDISYSLIKYSLILTKIYPDSDALIQQPRLIELIRRSEYEIDWFCLDTIFFGKSAALVVAEL